MAQKELQSVYLKTQQQRRLIALRVLVTLSFCCLFTAQTFLCSLAAIIISAFWHGLQPQISKIPYLNSDLCKLLVNSFCGQLQVLSGSPYGWVLCLAGTLCGHYIGINPYHSDYSAKLATVQYCAIINGILVLVCMKITGAENHQILQALFALESTRIIMGKIYELYSPLIFQLHSTNEEKSAFISVVSHEIRTPLTHIINSVELLEEVLQGSEILKQIQRSSGLLLRLINKILDYSKWRAQRTVIDNSMIDLRQVFKDIIDQFSFEVQTKGIYLNFEVEESISQFVLTDKLKLEELFLNLVGNAVKFTHQGGVTVSLKNKERKIEEEQVIEIVIEDTGIGISEEGMKTLFQPFSQADRKISSQYGGSGLGLSICKEITNCLDGTITVQSQFGAGTKMTVSIPLVVSGKGNEPDGPSDFVQDSELPSVILCEDNILIRKVLTQLLMKEGFKDIVVCSDGTELVEVFKSRRFKIVVTDQHMPNMNGATAIRILKEGYPSFSFRSILLTADVSFEKPGNVDRILTKPTNGRDLKRAILEEYQLI